MSTAPARHEPSLEEAAGPGPRLRDSVVGVVLLVGGVIGLAASLTLLLEKIALLQDPSFQPSCNLNPVLSCGSVMQTDQAGVFGLPNPVLGVMSFPVLVALGALVFSGTRLPRWVWWGLQAGATLGVAFVVWLIWQSLYEIGALCPYCMAVWVVVVPIFTAVTLRNLGAGVFGDGAARSALTRTLTLWHLALLMVVLLVVLALIAHRFWSFWTGG